MSNNKPFPVGSIVKLKSGGPDMTVRELTGSGVHAQWFAGKKLEQGYFPLDSVEAVAPKAE